jgi:two-component system, NtrC family, sensor histidine kinase HydH
MSIDFWPPVLELPVKMSTWTAPRSGPWWQAGNWRRNLIFLAVIALAVGHWAARHQGKAIHNLLDHLEVVPLLCAGVLFGFRVALYVFAAAALLEYPLIWWLWGNDRVYALDQGTEIAIYGIAGAVVGLLTDRERSRSAELERASGELAKVYAELRESIDRLKRAERLSAVAELSAGLAHEIRNPLAGISGAAGILKRTNASGRNVSECVEIIEKESNRLNRLLTGFLDFARPRPLRVQSTDLGAVFESVVAVASRAPEAARIEFQREIAGDFPEIECDSEQLKQVLLNLVINAIQATGAGIVRLTATTGDDMARIAVIDQGPGIPADQQERIFDPFFTTKDSGTGLGLAVASKIIQQHGGVMTARNGDAGGLAVLVELPLTGKRLHA